MVRTQISLTEDDVDLLDAVGRTTGASRSELIRRAVRGQYANTPAQPRGSPQERLADLRAAFGIWKDRPFTTEEYLDAIRHGKRLPDE